MSRLNSLSSGSKADLSFVVPAPAWT